MEEIWKVIKDSDGHYFISNLGRLKREEYEFINKMGKRFHRESFIKDNGNYNKYNGYCYYRYRGREGETVKISIHRLVALYFVENPNPQDYTQVNHIDGNKTNNKANNLEWCNERLNMEHASKHGLINRESEKRKEQAKENIKKAQEKVTKLYAKYDRDGNLIEIIKGTKHFEDSISLRRLTYKGYTYRSCEILIEKYGEVPNKIDAYRSFEVAFKSRKKYIEYTAEGEIKEYFKIKDLPISRDVLWFAFNHDIPDMINGSKWDIVKTDFPFPSTRKYKTQSVSALDDEGNVKFVFPSVKEALQFLKIKGANKFFDSIKLHEKYKGYYWVRNNA